MAEGIGNRSDFSIRRVVLVSIPVTPAIFCGAKDADNTAIFCLQKMQINRGDWIRRVVLGSNPVTPSDLLLAKDADKSG